MKSRTLIRSLILGSAISFKRLILSKMPSIKRAMISFKGKKKSTNRIIPSRKTLKRKDQTLSKITKVTQKIKKKKWEKMKMDHKKQRLTVVIPLIYSKTKMARMASPLGPGW